VAQLATEIMNISCVKSVGGPPKFFTRLDMLWRLAGNCSKNAMFCPCKTLSQNCTSIRIEWFLQACGFVHVGNQRWQPPWSTLV
jgi:hypothetical protein